MLVHVMDVARTKKGVIFNNASVLIPRTIGPLTLPP